MKKFFTTLSILLTLSGAIHASSLDKAGDKAAKWFWENPEIAVPGALATAAGAALAYKVYKRKTETPEQKAKRKKEEAKRRANRAASFFL